MSKKYSIIIQAGQQDVGRAVHGLLYGQELHEAGHEVKIFFDGAGTLWINEFEKADHPYNSLYKEVRRIGIIQGACAACSNFFDTAEEVKEAELDLLGDSGQNHFSFAKQVEEGFSPIIL